MFWWQITNVLWTISQKAGLNLIYNIKWKINQIKHITQPIIKTSSNTETAINDIKGKSSQYLNYSGV